MEVTKFICPVTLTFHSNIPPPKDVLSSNRCQHGNRTFACLDLRDSYKSVISRVNFHDSTYWSTAGGCVFIFDDYNISRCQIPGKVIPLVEFSHRREIFCRPSSPEAFHQVLTKMPFLEVCGVE